MNESEEVWPDQHNKWIITLTVMMGAFMMSVNAQSVNVALPHMKGYFGTSIEEITWVSTGYILATVIVMPLVGWLSSRFGRRRFYMACIFIFIVSSILCGLAWNLSSIVIFRVLQGVGGGTMMPVAQAILREIFPPEEQGTAMGIFGLGVVLGPAVGPTLGGWLTDYYSWPWVFYINIPVSIATLLLAARFIHDPPYLKREKGKIDILGMVPMIIGLGALQIMLAQGEINDWFSSQFIVALAVISLISITLFVIREFRTDKPAVDLRLLRNVNFATGNVIGAIVSMGLFSGLFLLPLFLQRVMGYPAVDSGLALVPRSIAMALCMPIAGRLYNKVGPIFLIQGGLLLAGFSFWQLSRLTLAAGPWDIFWPQFLQGIGVGMCFVSVTTAALATIEKPKMTSATGLYNFFRQTTGSIGIAGVASQLARGENKYRAILAENVTDYSNATHDWMQSVSAIFGPQESSAAIQERVLKLMEVEMTKQASIMAYNHVYFLIAGLFFFAIPIAFLLHAKGPFRKTAVVESTAQTDIT